MTMKLGIVDTDQSEIAIKVLRQAQRLLTGEVVNKYSSLVNAENWGKHIPAWCKTIEIHATDEKGNFTEPWDESACRWTAIGAVARYAMKPIPLSPVPGLRDESQFNAAWKYLFMAALIQSGGTSTPNGINNNGFEATKGLIDFAIRLAENKAELLITLAVEPESELGKEMSEKAAAAQSASGDAN